jgi:hypothetical protein
MFSYLSGDDQSVSDVEHAAGHPRGANRGVMLGPCANVALEGHRVALSIGNYVAVVGDQRVAVEGVKGASSRFGRQAARRYSWMSPPSTSIRWISAVAAGGVFTRVSRRDGLGG